MMKNLITLVCALVVGGSLLPTAADAQTRCGDRGDVVASLEKGYAERQVSMGLANNGTMIEIYASSNGTFSVLLTRPDGVSCLLAAGEHFEQTPMVAAGARI